MISVVIPALGDEAVLEANLPRLQSLCHAAGDCEVVVADGGSTDGTREVAARRGARVIQSKPGRGTQLNAGAAAARGDTLLFLHADCWLEEGALEEVQRILNRPGVVAGAFRQRIEGARRAYRWIEGAASMRTRYLGRPLGDSGLFLRRAVFDRVGGYPDVPLCEDLGMAARLRRVGKIELAQHRVHLSARRWERNGVLRTTMTNFWIALSYRAGVSPGRLYRTYYGRTLEI